MSDLVISVQSSLASDLLGSLDYPFRMRIDGNVRLAAGTAAPAGELRLDWLPPGATDPDGGFTADVEPLLDAAIDACMDSQSSSPFLAEEQQEDAEAAALIGPYLADEGSGRAARIAATKQRMAADSGFAERFEAFLKTRLGAGIDWIEAELSRMPSSSMGNPVMLGDLRVAVRAKAKACIRIFGREHCISATSPWIRFEGERAALFLDVEQTRIFGRARVSNLDFVMTIRIFGREIKIKIGVTGLVNEQLAKQRPLLADFSTVRIAVPGLNRTYEPTSVSVPSSSTETKVEVDGRFTRS